MVSMVTKRFDC